MSEDEDSEPEELEAKCDFSVKDVKRYSLETWGNNCRICSSNLNDPSMHHPDRSRALIVDLNHDENTYHGCDISDMLLWKEVDLLPILNQILPSDLAALTLDYLPTDFDAVRSCLITQSGELSESFIAQYAMQGSKPAATFLSALLAACTSLQHLIFFRLNESDMLEKVPRFHSFTTESITKLTLIGCDVSEGDMLNLGPCFINAKHLVWWMNRFDEALYAAYIEPYFEHTDFENDDGWHPGCEIWGDGQMTQVKWSNTHV